MPQTWEPDFDFYMTMIEDKPASIVLDLAAGPHIPVATHPLLLVVRIPMHQPRADGLRDATELDSLSEIEDTFTEKLAEAIDAMYAGRTVCDGDTTLYYYVPEEHRARLDDLPSITGDAGDYEPEWTIDEDPEWNLYAELLAPGPYDLQFIWNRRLIAVFEEKGDQLDQPREIDHFADFPSKPHAERAATALRAAGFTTDDLDPPENEDEPWTLQFHRSDSLGDGRADEFASQVLDIVLEHDGDYDGWGASHVGVTTQPS